jgi:hypothetical protein
MSETQQDNQAPADPLQAHYADIVQSQGLWRSRVEKARRDAAKPVTVGAVSSALDGDIYPFLLKTVELLAQLRDGVAAQMSAFEEQLASVGADGTSITAEDAAVLRQVVVDLRELVAVVRSAGVASSVEAKLAEYEAHATQAEALLDETTLEEDDGEDEAEGGEDEADGEGEG